MDVYIPVASLASTVQRASVRRGAVSADVTELTASCFTTLVESLEYA